MVIKTDGEPALIAVQEAIAANRVHETLVENLPAYDPQANGGAERAVAEVKAQLRAINIGLENLFKILRVDWVTSYSNTLQLTSGIRIGLNLFGGAVSISTE